MKDHEISYRYTSLDDALSDIKDDTIGRRKALMFVRAGDFILLNEKYAEAKYEIYAMYKEMKWKVRERKL